MSARQFPRFDETNAPAAARERLAATRAAFGAIPPPVMAYAIAPGMLAAALSGLETFEKTSLAPLEREVLAMTMGRINGCRFCLDLHRRLLLMRAAPRSLVEALEQGLPLAEPRLEALRRFVLSALAERGDVEAAVWDQFLGAGFTRAQALEVVFGISVYTLTTFANRLVEV